LQLERFLGWRIHPDVDLLPRRQNDGHCFRVDSPDLVVRRKHVVMLEAFDKGLLATTLRYAYEVQDQGAYFEDIPELKLPAEMIHSQAISSTPRRAISIIFS